MTRSDLVGEIKKKGSYLCVGLDTDINKIPKHLLKLDDPVFAFNKEIIDHTQDYAVSYKLNLAFYESLGSNGWESLVKTINYIPENTFTIADAKRGDIGNTADMYAKAFFEKMNFDAVTLSPYMGRDSILPFLKYEDKWAIILGLTSNEGAKDFQMQRLSNKGEEKFLFESIIEESSKWGNEGNIMYVVGATREEQFKAVRRIVPNHFLLVPGVGAQGGSLEDVSKNGLNSDAGLLINSSRGIIYKSDGPDFGEKAGKASKELQLLMKELLTSVDIT
jgi:orotidine-5'-phosphate decarboxylase